MSFVLHETMFWALKKYLTGLRKKETPKEKKMPAGLEKKAVVEFTPSDRFLTTFTGFF